MRPRRPDAELDKLYQLPLDEFTAARNALAREAGGTAGEIRALQKPPLAAWAVNQLYWKRRAVYDDLIDAATTLRSAHKAVLGGRRGDLRASSQTHDEALDRALKTTLELLGDAGHKATDATRQAVLNTLRALPSPDPPGRLARTLQPGGFEMLTGVEIGRTDRGPAARPVGRSQKRARDDEHAPTRSDRSAAQKRRTEAREAAGEAVREARELETELRRQEFTAARAAKEAEKANIRLAQAREALTAAEREVEEAERALAAANKARDRAQRAAEEAQGALDGARTRLERAQQAVEESDA